MENALLSGGTILALVFLFLVLKYYKQTCLTVNNTLHVNLQYNFYVPLLGDFKL